MKAHEDRAFDESVKKILITERNGIKKSIANLLKAIEEGVLTATTKNRMQELEEELALTEEKIAVEEYKEKHQLKADEVQAFISETLKKEPLLMINTFIQKIVLYGDRMDIYYNFIDHAPINDNSDKDSQSPDESQGIPLFLFGSDFFCSVAPLPT